MHKTRRLAVISTLAALAVHLIVTPSLAEVGVVVHPSGAVSSYILQIIVDEPDPATRAWVAYHVGDPGYSILNESGFDNGDQGPSLVTGSDPKLPIVAWAKSTPSGFDIVVSRFDGTGWGDPQLVAGTSADELDPSLAVDSNDGSLHLLYWVNDGSPRVLHRQAPADLSSWSPPVQVSHPGEVACRPSGVVRDGVLHVAYEVHSLGLGAAPREIVHAAESGPTFSSEIVATTQHAGDNSPRIHGAGELLWIDWIDGENAMAWTRTVAGGAWEPIRTEWFEGLEEREFHVRGLIRIQAQEP